MLNNILNEAFSEVRERMYKRSVLNEVTLRMNENLDDFQIEEIKQKTKKRISKNMKEMNRSVINYLKKRAICLEESEHIRFRTRVSFVDFGTVVINFNYIKNNHTLEVRPELNSKGDYKAVMKLVNNY